MDEPKIQRSYYLTQDQARMLKIRAAEMGMTASEVLGYLIEHMDTVQVKRTEVMTKSQEEARAQAAAKRKAQHDILAKMGKQ